jgi:hypothetical protein
LILDPPNDRDCLEQLTTLARELARTSAAYQLAASLGSARRVEAWLQSLPQADDDGREKLQAIVCDVPQRVRIFPADPNCFERTLAALALCEVLDHATPRCAVTIAKPVRHTSLAELRDGAWTPIDLFPRRNFAGLSSRGASGEVIGKDVLQGFHRYIGKPLLSAYGLGGVADQLGEVEDRAIGRTPETPSPSQTQSKPTAPIQTKPNAPSAAASSPSAPRIRTPQLPGEAPHATQEDRAPAASAPRPTFWPPYDRTTGAS